MCISFPDLEYQHGVLELVGLELPDLEYRYVGLELVGLRFPDVGYTLKCSLEVRGREAGDFVVGEAGKVRVCDCDLWVKNV